MSANRNIGPVTRSMSANRKIKHFTKVASAGIKTNSGRSIASAKAPPKSLFEVDSLGRVKIDSLGRVTLVRPMSKMTKLELWNCDMEYFKLMKTHNIMKTLAAQEVEMCSVAEEVEMQDNNVEMQDNNEELWQRERREIFNRLQAINAEFSDDTESIDEEDFEDTDEEDLKDTESLDQPINDIQKVEDTRSLDELIESINIDLGLSETQILLDMSCLSKEQIDNLSASMLGKFVKMTYGPDMKETTNNRLFKLEEKLQKNNYNKLVFHDRTNGVVIKFYYDWVAMWREISDVHEIDASRMIGATKGIKIKNFKDQIHGVIYKYVDGVPLNKMSKELLIQHRDTICDQYADLCEEMRVKYLCINEPLIRRLRNIIFDAENKTLHFINFENVEEYEETEENDRLFDRLNMLTCLNTHINTL